jgi:hypothetical protein
MLLQSVPQIEQLSMVCRRQRPRKCRDVGEISTLHLEQRLKRRLKSPLPLSSALQSSNARHRIPGSQGESTGICSDAKMAFVNFRHWNSSVKSWVPTTHCDLFGRELTRGQNR